MTCILIYIALACTTSKDLSLEKKMHAHFVHISIFRINNLLYMFTLMRAHVVRAHLGGKYNCKSFICVTPVKVKWKSFLHSVKKNYKMYIININININVYSQWNSYRFPQDWALPLGAVARAVLRGIKLRALKSGPSYHGNSGQWRCCKAPPTTGNTKSDHHYTNPGSDFFNKL